MSSRIRPLHSAWPLLTVCSAPVLKYNSTPLKNDSMNEPSPEFIFSASGVDPNGLKELL